MNRKPPLHWTDPGIVEANEDGTASVRPTPQPDENVSPRTEAGRTLVAHFRGADAPHDFLEDILAIEAETNAPALDVERLARALHANAPMASRHLNPAHPELHVGVQCWCESQGRRIAAEYARLQNPEPDR